MKKRIEWVDVAKGIGILLVVYGHVIVGLNASSLHYSGIGYDLQWQFIYGMHMPLFFLLSGMFVESWAHRNFAVALKQKAVSLAYPYFIWGILQGLIMWILKSKINADHGGGSLLSILRLPIQPFGQFWFLYDLFFIFLIYFFLRKFLSLKVLLVVSLVLNLVSPLFNGWQLYRLAFYLFFFVLGSFLRAGGFFNQIKSKVNWISIPLYILVNLVMWKLTVSNTILNGLAKTVTALVGIYFIVYISYLLSHVQVLDYIGKISLQIFVMHILATAGTRIVLISFLGITSIPIHLVIGFILGTILPIIVTIIADKLKIHKYLFGR